jgi:hypothetical protein
MSPTTTEKIAARIEDLPEGSMRRRLLEGARRFKASWVEFGRLLSQVRRERLWEDWGFASFETYCAKELFIRKQTAEKLTLSYGFLEKHEPELTRGREVREAPAFEVIEVLSRAEASGRFDEAGYRQMRDEIWDRAATPAAVNRRLSEQYGPSPRKGTPPREERLKRLAAAARKVADGCQEEKSVPAAVAQRAAALALDLEELAGD